VSARFAQPIVDGKPLFLAQLRTQIWFLLYAQAAQVDGNSQKRNILGADRPNSSALSDQCRGDKNSASSQY
jgi:hypothetical protein